MRKLLALLVSLLVLPIAFAVDIGTGIGIDITPEEFEPLIWLCDSRVVLEDCVEAGRVTDCDDPLAERIENYAFEGEQILWQVLVMDKNKIEEIEDVVATLDGFEEVECARAGDGGNGGIIPDTCNARILQEDLTGTAFDSETQEFYDCVLTVESPASMVGEYFITVEAISVDGSATMDEIEYWFLNPVIGVSVLGDLTFDDVRPGTVSYSEPILVGNDADDGSGVLLDMFISGTDFYDPASSGAKCPESNRLKLSQDLRSQALLGGSVASGPSFGTPCNAGDLAGGLSSVDNNDHVCYYATNGAYSTATHPSADAEGYVPIVYSDVFTRDFYNDAEILVTPAVLPGGYYAGNVLTPGAELSVVFKLGLPEPCVGDFSEGSLFFWGEAI